jgi:nucleotide-binding universal stress UspA family protein
MSEFALETSAFQNAQAIPSRHGCEGDAVERLLEVTERCDADLIVVGGAASK